MLELLDLELLLFTDLIPSVPGSKPLSNILRLILNCNVRGKSCMLIPASQVLAF